MAWPKNARSRAVARNPPEGCLLELLVKGALTSSTVPSAPSADTAALGLELPTHAPLELSLALLMVPGLRLSRTE
eukprot:CAMPEP_0175893774 /NCGR_PEP_ID=MMETSP0107_2-20121207/49643_1 /TAXON_ID=195067 ORGANISM="Goniomonas pacifica, Strain CCMP1869" /NCGR_SAMPLE_ID=MMETSP0107_2 /ASSEMBLY_ACC=CAM_ASM_000203 /LENGTH=74 /DNA_ID=CAMNT_0017214833 /DNA_START=306 /DNA_END=531 /DNA_ORIENTATION=-